MNHTNDRYIQLKDDIINAVRKTSNKRTMHILMDSSILRRVFEIRAKDSSTQSKKSEPGFSRQDS